MRPALLILAASTAGLAACSSTAPTTSPTVALPELTAESSAAPLVPATPSTVTLAPGATASVAPGPGAAASPATALPPAPTERPPTTAPTMPPATTPRTTAPATSAAPPVPPLPVVQPPAPAPPRAPAPAATPAPAPPAGSLPPPEDPLAPLPPLETAPPPGQPVCRAETLTVTDADAVYTSTAVQELFTLRTSGPDCELEGYPSVQLLGPGGPLPMKVRRGGFGLPAAAPVPVALNRGTSLSFFIATARDADCPVAQQLVVTLPGTYAARRAATSMQVCRGEVGVTPVGRVGDKE